MPWLAIRTSQFYQACRIVTCEPELLDDVVSQPRGQAKEMHRFIPGQPSQIVLHDP